MKNKNHIYKDKRNRREEESSLHSASRQCNVRRWPGALALVVAMLFAASLQSCSDNLDEGNPNSPKGKTEYYFNIDVTVPQVEEATRGSTTEEGNSSDLWETAASNESAVLSADIFLCQDDVVKIHLTSEGWYKNPDGTITLMSKFNDINEFLEMAKDGEDIQLFIVANTNETSLDHDFKKGSKNAKEATFSIGGATSRPIGDFGNDGKGQSMPLVNAKPLTFKINLESENPLESLLKLFQSGQVGNKYYVVKDVLDLERAVARIEFRDLNTDERANEGLPETENLYPIRNVTGVYGKISAMQVFNINNKSYLFRHACAGNEEVVTDIDELELLGYEKGKTPNAYNWIATPDWTSTGKNTSGFHNKFQINETEGTYGIDGDTKDTYITVEDLLTRSTDPSGYHPWCYVSENTIPSVEIMKDADKIVKYATGVLFKVLVCIDDKGTPLQYSATKENYPLGVFNTRPGYIEIMDDYGYWVEVKNDGGYYYLYYIATIVHNDDPKYATSENLPPMFFGIVRNNTYQMTVKSITNLPNPKDPQSLYLELDLNVLPWDKREVNWEF